MARISRPGRHLHDPPPAPGRAGADRGRSSGPPGLRFPARRLHAARRRTQGGLHRARIARLVALRGAGESPLDPALPGVVLGLAGGRPRRGGARRAARAVLDPDDADSVRPAGHARDRGPPPDSARGRSAGPVGASRRVSPDDGGGPRQRVRPGCGGGRGDVAGVARPLAVRDSDRSSVPPRGTRSFMRPRSFPCAWKPIPALQAGQFLSRPVDAALPRCLGNLELRGRRLGPRGFGDHDRLELEDHAARRLRGRCRRRGRRGLLGAARGGGARSPPRAQADRARRRRFRGNLSRDRDHGMAALPDLRYPFPSPRGSVRGLCDGGPVHRRPPPEMGSRGALRRRFCRGRWPRPQGGGRTPETGGSRRRGSPAAALRRGRKGAGGPRLQRSVRAVRRKR